MWDFRGFYRYVLNPDSRVRAKVGFALAVQDWVSQLESLESGADTKGSVTNTDFFPLPYLQVDAGITDKLHFVADASGISLGENWTADARGAIRYQFDRTWDIGVGYRYTLRGIDEARAASTMQLHTVYFAVGFSWGERGAS